MTIRELKTILVAHPSATPRFVLPGNDKIPAHFHITEVGHVTKRFIDCGGQRHDRTEACLLQTYVGEDVEHRLNAGTFAKILDLGRQVLPHEDIEIEVEYENCAVTQAPITSVAFIGEEIHFQLGEKHTDCLAKERCGINGDDCGTNQEEAVGGEVGCC
jgi:Family of unknown function (DUF6428)